MNVATYTNSEAGIKAVVIQAEDGLYDVAAFDTDANLMIEARHGFPTEAGAREYAAKFML